MLNRAPVEFAGVLFISLWPILHPMHGEQHHAFF